MVREINDVIINARRVLTRRARRRDRLLTLALWALYAYLWLPLISLFAWLLGLQFAYTLVERAGGPASLVNLLYWFGLFVLLISLCIVGWSRFQLRRFGERERRLAVPTVTFEQEAAYWDIDRTTLTRLRERQQNSVTFDSDGRLQLLEHPQPSAGSQIAS
ncbi:MAG: poly-beta-1,6-N-acetyl-D-glucosamine biosynthesis protein PgaD [Pseudomonadales bacterium]